MPPRFTASSWIAFGWRNLFWAPQQSKALLGQDLRGKEFQFSWYYIYFKDLL